MFFTGKIQVDGLCSLFCKWQVLTRLIHLPLISQIHFMRLTMGKPRQHRKN